jgi:hypothetical protein
VAIDLTIRRSKIDATNIYRPPQTQSLSHSPIASHRLPPPCYPLAPHLALPEGGKALRLRKSPNPSHGDWRMGPPRVALVALMAVLAAAVVVTSPHHPHLTIPRSTRSPPWPLHLATPPSLSSVATPPHGRLPPAPVKARRRHTQSASASASSRSRSRTTTRSACTPTLYGRCPCLRCGPPVRAHCTAFWSISGGFLNRS